MDADDLLRQLDRVVDTHRPTPSAVDGVKDLMDWMKQEATPSARKPQSPPHTGGPDALALTGDLDMASAENVRDVLYSALNDGTGDLVLNLSGLTFCDATGLGVIMGAHRRAARLGRRLVLQDVPRHLERVLVATRLNGVLEIESSVTEGDGSPQPALGLCEDTAGRYR